MTRIERVTSPLPRECSTTEPHGRIRRAGPHEPLIYRYRALHINFATTLLRTSLYPVQPARATGAGEGNRTLVVSLEGFCSTIELHPPGAKTSEAINRRTNTGHNICTAQHPTLSQNTGGGGWIRTNVGVRQQIYSLPPLATRAPLREEPAIMA